MLYPIQDYFQKINHHSLKITNKPSVEIFDDKFGNKLGIFSILSPHSQLNITSNIEIEIKETIEPIFDTSIEKQWEEYKTLNQDFALREFLFVETIINKNAIEEIVLSLKNETKTPLENAKKFSEYIFLNFEYRQGVTSIETEIDEIWHLKAGVCQDFAHLLLMMLRIIKIPARYVSGYICPQNHELRGEGATHAWVEIFIPNYGWIGLDPTNNCIASDKHVRLATGRSFADCTPVKGIFKGNLQHRLEVSVIVENVDNIQQNSYSKNLFQESNIITNPSFVSVSISDNSNENSYLVHKQIQQQIQMQQ